jgi:hypothetical protein
MAAWVFFRAESIGDAFTVFQRLFIFETFNFNELFNSALYGWYSLFFVILVFVLDWFSKDGDINNVTKSMTKSVRWSFYYFLLFAIIFFGEFQAAPEFIYFQF